MWLGPEVAGVDTRGSICDTRGVGLLGLVCAVVLEGSRAAQGVGDHRATEEAAGVEQPLHDQAVDDGHHQCGGDLRIERRDSGCSAWRCSIKTVTGLVQVIRSAGCG